MIHLITFIVVVGTLLHIPLAIQTLRTLKASLKDTSPKPPLGDAYPDPDQ